MRASDRYHKWIEWSDEDNAYLGRCPGVITRIHGSDPMRLYRELCEGWMTFWPPSRHPGARCRNR